MASRKKAKKKTAKKKTGKKTGKKVARTVCASVASPPICSGNSRATRTNKLQVYCEKHGVKMRDLPKHITRGLPV